MRAAAAVLAPLALAAGCALVAFLRPLSLKTSLYDLAGSAAAAVPESVRRHSSNLVPVMVESADEAAARTAAVRLAALLPSNQCASIRLRVDDDGGLASAIDAVRRNRAGLVSDDDLELLQTPEGRRELAESAARKYYTSLIPPMFPVAEDPFCLADSFVKSLPAAFSGWRPSGGFLTASHDGRTTVLVLITLKDSVANDTGALIDFRRRLDEAVSEAASGLAATFYACGVPIHTAIAAERCRTEIGWLSCFSIAFIACLALLAFRSLRSIGLVASSLALSAAAGALALVSLFDSIHVMTIVFGTSVLGLVVDYSFHLLAATQAGRAGTLKRLLVSFATTEISLVPLALSSLAVLRQTATFLGVALAAALAFAAALYPPADDGWSAASQGRAPRFCSAPALRIILGALLAAAVAGWLHLTFATDPAALYAPPKALAEAERRFAELGGASDPGRGFLVTGRGDDLEACLAAEAEAADAAFAPLAAGERPQRLSRFMPPLERRRAAAALVEKLYDEQGAYICELLGMKTLEPPPAPAAWRWEDVPAPLERAFVAGRSLIVPSSPRPAAPLPDGVTFCQPRQMLADALATLSSEALHRLAFALAMMALALAALCRRRALKAMLPSLFALAIVAGALGFSGIPVNLFHLLAAFLLVGMGVDYAVFLATPGAGAFKPALCSLLTSMAGFGALAFVSFPPVRAFGFVLGIGLGAAFLCALAIAPAQDGDVGSPASEHCASPLGMEVLLILYRVLGLRALHFFAACVATVAWLSTPAARRASPSLRKAVAFSRSLADKLVVMAQGRRLPHVTTDGSQDAHAFLKDVAAGRGVFVLSSHCGTIEVLAALGECDTKFHAWMDFPRTSVFNAFYMRHARRSKVEIHPISEFGMATAFFAGDALDAGECLVMAGDRGFGRRLHMPFGDGEIELPEGAFRFAASLGHPVYFVSCIATGSCQYTAHVLRLPAKPDAMARAYAAALHGVASAHPEQWFTWEGGRS